MKTYLVIYYYDGAPDEKDRLQDIEDLGANALVVRELEQMKYCGVDQIDLYDITGRDGEWTADIEIDSCGDCVASAAL